MRCTAKKLFSITVHMYKLKETVDTLTLHWLTITCLIFSTNLWINGVTKTKLNSNRYWQQQGHLFFLSCQQRQLSTNTLAWGPVTRSRWAGFRYWARLCATACLHLLCPLLTLEDTLNPTPISAIWTTGWALSLTLPLNSVKICQQTTTGDDRQNYFNLNQLIYYL